MPATLSVSTHSRPKAAGLNATACNRLKICFNTQPPEGGWRTRQLSSHAQNSFNTQPPEGGWTRHALLPLLVKSFNTQPPEGGWTFSATWIFAVVSFQHTAARRRLGYITDVTQYLAKVSTHSRPKAAAKPVSNL